MKQTGQRLKGVIDNLVEQLLWLALELCHPVKVCSLTLLAFQLHGAATVITASFKTLW